jgi:hypothetical protein
LCPGEFRLHAFVRHGARRDDVLGPGHFLAGLPIDNFQIRRFARLPMDNDRGFALGREMLISEGMKIKQDGLERAPDRCENVVNPERRPAVDLALEEATAHQLLQAPAQNGWRNAQPLSKFVEFSRTVHGVAKYQNTPPLADVLKGPGYRTLHRLKARSLHE